MKKLVPLAILFASGLSAQAAVVFQDDFEAGTGATSLQGSGTTPDVSSYTLANTSGQANTTLWVRATSGFNSTRNGLIDDLGTDNTYFADPVGQQAYGFRYTNSGLTSAYNTIGALATGQTITVTFDLVMDGFNTGTAFEVALVTFNGAGTRNALNGDINLNTSSVLARITGNVAADGNYHQYSFAYTVGDDVVDSNGAAGGVSTTFDSAVLGHDIAFRIKGATTYANIDNVSVDITAIPEPTAAVLGGIGVLVLLRRRRQR